MEFYPRGWSRCTITKNIGTYNRPDGHLGGPGPRRRSYGPWLVARLLNKATAPSSKATFPTAANEAHQLLTCYLVHIFVSFFNIIISYVDVLGELVHTVTSVSRWITTRQYSFMLVTDLSESFE
jgi:hypothetical protein